MQKYPINSTLPKTPGPTTTHLPNKITTYRAGIEPNGQIASAEARDRPVSISANELRPPSSQNPSNNRPGPSLETFPRTTKSHYLP
jgi:hypothetical protein